MLPIVTRTKAKPFAAWGWPAELAVEFCAAAAFVVIMNLCRTDSTHD
jgi:hypothetical protein